MYHLKIHPFWFSLHARFTCVDRGKMYTRDLYGRFKALESLVLFFLLEIKWKKQIYNINWFSMLQNLISSQVHLGTHLDSNSNCSHPTPPPFPHTTLLSLNHTRSRIYSYLLLCMPTGWWTFNFLFFFSFFSSLPFRTHERCFTTSNGSSVSETGTAFQSGEWKRLREHSFYWFSGLTCRMQIYLDCNPRSLRFRWRAPCDLVSLFRIFAANESFFSSLKWKRRTRKRPDCLERGTNSLSIICGMTLMAYLFYWV